ncbi:MAG: type I asparaginase [Prevotella sp.]|nr:type I asparaginase [Prevotella sp.]
MTNKILLIYTGGTIGMGSNPVTHALEPLDFNHLLRQLPEYRYIKAEVDIYQFDAIDSSNMTPRRWAQLVRIITLEYDNYDGFVILHGTDTMAYTASALSFMLENLTKPVILTGSQLPLGMLRTDGKENLITSIELAAMQDAKGRAVVPEVCIYFSGRLLRGNRSSKKNADGFQAFDSANFPHLCEAGVDFRFNTREILRPDFSRRMTPHTAINSNVVVLSLFPGIEESLLRHVLRSNTLKGIVLRSYGSGNAPQFPWLTALMRDAVARGIIVVNVTQCDTGRVEMERYSAGNHLLDAGVLSGYDGTVEATVTKLMVLLAQHSDAKGVRTMMSRSLAGEITV